MEMEIDENHSHGAEITRTEITDNNKHQIHTTLGRENSNQAEDEPFLGIYEEMFDDGFHRYVCSECNVPKPSARLLEIHVQEIHDSFFKLLAKRQPMYECYVSECDLKFRNSSERREHCISEHKFSQHFRYDEDRSKIPEQERIRRKLKNDVKLSNENQNKSEKRKSYEEHESLKSMKRKSSICTLDNCCTSFQLNKPKSTLVFIPRQVIQNECMMDT